MWLCTKYGFFSIVRKASDEFHVRARKREDLENLKKAVETMAEKLIPSDCMPKLMSDLKISESFDADYRFRMVVTSNRHEFYIMRALTESVDYPNFKSMVHSNDQADKYQIYTDLWHSMFTYQQENQ